ncbi:MAG: TPM domain-containing protein [Lachnospiraceae bacterium]|nr:TPM domain-containing protein [Lachnospiraceae bacterium]
MKNKISVFILMLVCCLSFGMVVSADEENAVRLMDMADLLTDTQESRILAVLDEISDRQRLDIVVVTTNSLDGKTPVAYADDFYDENGYGFGAERDGVLLLVSMEDRDWRISTFGYGITVFTDAGMDYMSDQFVPDLGDGSYEEAFICFAHLCDQFITQARVDTPYDAGILPKMPFSVGDNLSRALLMGLFAAVMITLIMRCSMKSVRLQPTATAYVKRGSMHVTESRDLFLYSHVDRSMRQEQRSSGGGSQTHTSSSGRTHGGRGGKFNR